MDTQDKLEQLLAKQRELNDQVFAKRELRDLRGEILTMATIQREFLLNRPLGPNTLVNTWLKNYNWALKDESRELDEELLWKWWSKDTLDLQNIRVEIVDQLHFLLSLALVAGLDANELFRLYMLKHQVNQQRQEQDYSKATKNEQDNLGVQ